MEQNYRNGDIEMKETYLDIMQQSLEKKILVLEHIIELNQKQRRGLENPELGPDEFDEIVEAKQQMIDQLEQLDSGFERLFENVKNDLGENKEQYVDRIRKMQELIWDITDRSVEIQVQEQRNKDLMTQKFSDIRQKAKSLRTSNKVASQYYKNMAKLNYVDPQFMDDKH